MSRGWPHGAGGPEKVGPGAGHVTQLAPRCCWRHAVGPDMGWGLVKWQGEAPAPGWWDGCLVGLMTGWRGSVSLSTRGQTDMRGLGTARRCSAGAYPLVYERVSPAGAGCLIGPSRVTPRAAFAAGSVIKQPVGSVLVVEDCQGPAPAGQLAGDGDVGDRGALVSFDEPHPAGVQSPVAGIASCPGCWGCQALSAGQAHPDPVGGSVMPGGLDQQPAGVGVAGLGDRPLPAA